jgi:chromosome segregation ATPase
MDPITIILGALALVGIPAAFVFGKGSGGHAVQSPKATLPEASKAAAVKAYAPAANANNDDAAKLEAARSEIASAKEKLAKKERELEDMREQARSKARREAKKDQRDVPAAASPTNDPRDVEIQSLRKGMAALESQLNSVKREREQAASSSTEVEARTRSAVDNAERAMAGERDRRRSLEEETTALKRTIEDLRAALKKQDARPEVPGSTLDLKSLPTPVVQEMSRYFRKSEEFERLYTIAQSQLQLDKDRFLELQRRYFAVCRELAVQAGLPANAADAMMRQKAEEVVDEADARAAARLQRAPQASASASMPGLPGEAGAGPARRKRRRRRRVVGEPVLEDAGADDGDEGDDDGVDEVTAAGDSGAGAPA